MLDTISVEVCSRLLSFDTVLSSHQDKINDLRTKMDAVENLHDTLFSYLDEAGQFLAKQAQIPGAVNQSVNVEVLKKVLEPQFFEAGSIDVSKYSGKPVGEVGNLITSLFKGVYDSKIGVIDPSAAIQIEHQIIGLTIQQAGKKHIENMIHLRESLHQSIQDKSSFTRDYKAQGEIMLKRTIEVLPVNIALNILHANITITKKENTGIAESNATKSIGEIKEVKPSNK